MIEINLFELVRFLKTFLPSFPVSLPLLVLIFFSNPGLQIVLFFSKAIGLAMLPFQLHKSEMFLVADFVDF